MKEYSFFSALIIPIGGKLSLWTNFHGMAKHFKQISGESKQLYSTSTNFSVENSRDIIILRGGRTIDDANNKTSTILSLLSSPLNKFRVLNLPSMENFRALNLTILLYFMALLEHFRTLKLPPLEHFRVN